MLPFLLVSVATYCVKESEETAGTDIGEKFSNKAVLETIDYAGAELNRLTTCQDKMGNVIAMRYELLLEDGTVM